MAGLFSFFGGKKNPDGTPKQKQEAYFLDSDSAKTYGDIDYMRTSKTIKHKFPKTFSNKAEFEQTDSVSAMDKMNDADSPMTPKSEDGSTDQWQPAAMNGMNSNGASSNTSFASGSSAKEEERKADSSMDMFRNMAREMRKR